MRGEDDAMALKGKCHGTYGTLQLFVVMNCDGNSFAKIVGSVVQDSDLFEEMTLHAAANALPRFGHDPKLKSRGRVFDFESLDYASPPMRSRP